MSVREVLATYPQAPHVLVHFGISFGGDGKYPLKTAAADAGVPLQPFLAVLDTVISDSEVPGGDNGRPELCVTRAIIGHIRRRYHAFMRDELPRLEQLLEEMRAAHRARHGRTLEALAAVFRSLKTELEEHMLKEELSLFPAVCRYLQRRDGKAPGLKASSRPAASEAIREMEHEHELADAGLAELRALTSNYTPPDDACEKLAALYKGLAGLEANLAEHIRVENDFLWPVRSRKKV